MPRLWFVIVLFLSVSSANAHLVSLQYQNYSDSENTTVDSQILQYRHNFYFFENPDHVSNVRFQYKLDHLKSPDEQGDNAHGFSLGVTQGILPSTRIAPSLGYSFDRESHLFNYGLAVDQGFLNDNLSVMVGFNRVNGRKPVNTFLSRELVPTTTSDVQEGNEYYVTLTQIFTPQTVGRLGGRYVTRNEQADAFVANARLHQWLPWRGSVQGEYSYFFNVGGPPATSELGKMRAHIFTLGLYQYFFEATMAGVTYRYYDETEELESNFSNIVGSDLYGLKLAQGLAPFIGGTTFDDVQVELNLYRYLNNQGNQAWIASLGTNLSF